MIFLTNSVLAYKARLFLYVLSMILIAISVKPASAQSESEISDDFANYALSHTEDETRAYVAAKISLLTTQEYFYDHSLSTIAGFFLDGTECIRVKHEICDRQYEEALFRLTGESAILAAGCVLITSSNPCLELLVDRAPTRAISNGYRRAMRISISLTMWFWRRCSVTRTIQGRSQRFRVCFKLDELYRSIANRWFGAWEQFIA